jgi:outer membrane protein insertion porin family
MIERRSRGLARGAALAAALFVAPIGAGAQDFNFGAFVVEGNALVPDGTILDVLGVAPGRAVSAAQLNAGGQELRASGLFESVEIVPRGGTLIVRVVEFPALGQVAFEGNTVIGDDELRALASSVGQRVFSPARAEADAAAIARAHAERGLVNALVVPAIIRRPDNRVDLVFQVDEGGRTEVERISFVGNRDFSDRRLRNVLETRQAGWLRALVRADTFVAERIAFDRTALTDFYRSRGYADFRIDSVDVNLTAERDAYLITFNVTEGQRFAFGAVTVSSTIPEAEAALFERIIHTRPGQTYSPIAIENDIARIETEAARLGLAFVRVEPRITRDPAGRTLDIDYALVPGERIFVERIDIEGNQTTLDRVIRAQFGTVEGDPFNPRELRASAERIRALGFFADTQVEARPGSAPDQVVIDVTVEEQPTGSLTFGANYSTDEGVGLIASFAERNFLGRGQALRFELSAGQVNRVLTLDFAEPRFLGRDLRFGLEFVYRQTRDEDALYDTDRFRLSPSFTFPLSERNRLELLYALDYSDITGVSGERGDPPEDRASLLIFDEADEAGVWTQALGYGWSWDSRRDGLPSDSFLLLRLGQEFGFGDERFIRTTGRAVAETRVLGGDLTLRATLEGGLIDHADGSTRVTDRFFLGSRLMRGFERGGIGPRDAATDDALGGNVFAVLQLETEFPLGLPQEYGITGGAFVDLGSVWDVGDLRSLSEEDVLYNDFTPRAVAGLSVFVDSPIGPLRLNFTHPLEVEEFDRTRSFDVTVSTRF